MPIHPRLRRTLLVRGTLAWLFARLMAAMVLSIQASAPGAAPQSVVQRNAGLLVTMWVIGFSVALVYVDVRRRKEWLLLGNLGLGPVGVIAVALSLAACLEAAWLLV